MKKDSKIVKKGLRPRNKLGYIDPTIAGIDLRANLIHVAIPNSDGGADVLEFKTI